VASIGFYGVKGGIFTILKGGIHRVQGPPGTFIEGNNEMALAMVMTIPLIALPPTDRKEQEPQDRTGGGHATDRDRRRRHPVARALVALTLTGSMFWLKSRNKFFTAVLIAIAALVTLSIMPAEWFERMNTIKAYDEDESAQGRINAWWTAFNLANGRFVGGGFETWRPMVFEMFAPDPNNVRDVHSIYFEVLGEHGWVGLTLFLSILGLTWLKCSSIIRLAKKHPETLWARDLAAMIQVTMVAYMSAGAFLGLAYFDYIYHLVAIVVVVHHLLRAPQPLAPQLAASAPPNPPSRPRLGTAQQS